MRGSRARGSYQPSGRSSPSPQSESCSTVKNSASPGISSSGALRPRAGSGRPRRGSGGPRRGSRRAGPPAPAPARRGAPAPAPYRYAGPQRAGSAPSPRRGRPPSGRAARVRRVANGEWRMESPASGSGAPVGRQAALQGQDLLAQDRDVEQGCQVRRLAVAHPLAEQEVSLQLAQAAPGDPKELLELLGPLPAPALGDVGRDRSGGPASLRGQAEDLLAREGAGQPIDLLRERHRPLPDLQVSIGLHGPHEPHPPFAIRHSPLAARRPDAPP